MSAILALLVFGGLLLAWVPGRWAVAAPQIGIFALTAAWLVRKQIRRDALYLPWPAFLLTAAAMWGPLQLFAGASVYRWQTAADTLGWLAALCVFCLAADLGESGTTRKRLLDATIWFGCLLAVQGTVQLFTSAGEVFWLFPSGYKDLVIGPFVYQNQYAAFVELLLPLTLAAGLDRPHWRFPALLTAAFLIASVVASGSRAGTVLVCIETAAVLGIAALRGMIGPRVAMGLALASALFVAALGPELLWRRMGESQSVMLRQELNHVSLDMLRERPDLGYGLGNWPHVYPRFARSDDGLYANRAHNDWLEWAVEGGAPFVLVIGVLAAWSVSPAVVTLWGFGVIPFWIHCSLDYPARKPALAMLFFFLLGLMGSRTRRG
ncbi:MAG: O-antigen ligase family protein [Bryobacteraceae bacterium]